MWIFRQSLLTNLGQFERVEADDGCIGEHPKHAKCPNGFTNPKETLLMQQRIQNRQESVNNRFKFWEILKQFYRHDIDRHGEIVRSIVVITQLAINNGEKLFQTGYRDPPYDDSDASTTSSTTASEDNND